MNCKNIAFSSVNYHTMVKAQHFRHEEISVSRRITLISLLNESQLPTILGALHRHF